MSKNHHSRTFQTIKKLNLVSGRSVSRFREIQNPGQNWVQFAVPNVRRTNSRLEESRCPAGSPN